MTYSTTADWILARAALDESSTPGAGPLAARPHVPGEAFWLRGEETRLAFARFVNMARRRRGWSIEKLADDADIEVGELMSIEQDAHHEPELRTIWRLSEIFDVSQTRLMELAGLVAPKDTQAIEEAVRYAARSTAITALTAEEQVAFDGLVSVLRDKAK